MYAADAFLFLAVVGVDIGPPVGGKARLDSRNELRQAVAERKQALGAFAAHIADERKTDAAGQAEQDLRRGQCDAVGHGHLGDAAELIAGQRAEKRAAVLVPERDDHDAEADDRRHCQQIDIGRKKAGQQINKVVAALHPQGLGSVGL